jgi:hypothetical protein
MCDEAGIDPQAVGLKIAWPVIEHAMLEDDDGLRERWAALLANAAAGDRGAEVRPAFPRILSDLEPVEAVMLERLAALRSGQMSRYLFMVEMGVEPRDAEARTALDVHVGNLVRLNLCELIPATPDVRRLAEDLSSQQRALDNRRGAASSFPRSASIQVRNTDPAVRVSALGRAFLAACTPPAERGQEPRQD